MSSTRPTIGAAIVVRDEERLNIPLLDPKPPQLLQMACDKLAA
jgi:hypothetical protein